MLQQIYPSVNHSFIFELNKDLHFAAAHYIPSDLAGKCSRMHGHTYYMNVCIVGDDLDETGFLVNFSDLKALIHDRFDHNLINDDLLFNEGQGNIFPSTEVVARTAWTIIQDYLDTLPNQPKCLQVFLRETPTSYVIYRPRIGDRL